MKLTYEDFKLLDYFIRNTDRLDEKQAVYVAFIRGLRRRFKVENDPS